MDAETLQPWLRLGVLLCFLLSCCLQVHVCSSADTIYSGQSLTGTQTISSLNGWFELGFFARGSPKRYYIGIWYKEIPDDRVVWVANRDRPLPDESAEFKISEDGNLVIQTQSKELIWSTNRISSNSSPSSRAAVLLNSGNLALRDGISSGSFIWESFNNPTDTWLPGGKLGMDKATKQNQLLVSWKNSDDPSPGPFSLEMDPNGTAQYFIIWNKTQQYWTSGIWNGQIFSEVTEMRSNYIFNFSFITDESLSYFTYSVYDPNTVTKFVMDLSGQIKQLTWVKETHQWNLFWSQPREQCAVYALCGAYGICNQDKMNPCNCINGFEPMSAKDWELKDWSGGCVRKTKLQCGNDQFSVLTGVKPPVNPDTVAAGSAGGCKSSCLTDCSCIAYSYQGNICLIWKGDLLNLQQLSDGSGNTIFVRIYNNEIHQKTSASVIIGGIIGGTLAVLAIVVVLIWLFTRRTKLENSKVQGFLVSFRYRDLEKATRNFSEKLGGGGFGSVHKGTLPDSSVVAVKKLEGLRQGEKQFRTEVSTIGTIQHLNLIRLRGFCSEGTKRLLVYDFMQNGSLDFHLFKENCNPLNWKTRYAIALGTARGISYLHEKCRDCIIHCDIKPENVLLDADLCPKVADFGLAKLLGREFSRVLTTFRGTRGYLAPEWISGMPITPKADVYSYGMMMLELISGRRNVNHSDDGQVGYFPTWAANKMIEGEVFTLLDPRLDGEADLEELTRVCRVAVWCIQDDEIARPSMGQVEQILEKVLEIGMPPVPRSLQVLVDKQENIVFFSEGSDRSSKPHSGVSSSSQTKSSSSSSM